MMDKKVDKIVKRMGKVRNYRSILKHYPPHLMNFIAITYGITEFCTPGNRNGRSFKKVYWQTQYEKTEVK